MAIGVTNKKNTPTTNTNSKVSQTRDAIVQIVRDNEIRRPEFNVERNASGVDVRAAHVAIPLNDRDPNLFLDYEFYHPH